MLTSMLRLWFLVLGTILVPSAYGLASDTCVTSFSEFEKAAIKDSVSNVDALVRAFYRTNTAFPLSVQVIYYINSSNGTGTTISTDPNCPLGEEMWLWVPSPVFIFMEPTKLNVYALHTLNYFSHWKPQKANISVPNICDIGHNKFNFLNDFTMRAQTYAAASLSSEHGYLGYVLRGCGTNPFKTLIAATLPNNDDHREMLSKVMVCFFVWGNICQIVLILLVSALFLHNCKKGHTIERYSTTTQSSFDNYGIFWGCVTVSILGSVLLTIHTMIIVKMHLTSGVYELAATGWMVLAQMVLAITASLLVAIYYCNKLDVIVPAIFLLPFVIICCNHAKKTSKNIVRCLSLWSLLMFIIHVFCRSGFIFLALLARPPVVITTALLCIFAVFCFVHLLAILFTFAKAKMMHQKRTNINSFIISLAQALVFTAVFAAAICYGTMIGYTGVLATYGTIMNSPYSMLSTVATPLALAVFGWAMRKVGFQWLKTVTNPEATKETEKLPLLQEFEGNMNGNAGDGQGFQEKRSKVIGWLMH